VRFNVYRDNYPFYSILGKLCKIPMHVILNVPRWHTDITRVCLTLVVVVIWLKLQD
jgi:hypothetical protein